MEDILVDVDKIRVKVENLVGTDLRVDPNKIFMRLEGLVEESPDMRVERVVKEMVVEMKSDVESERTTPSSVISIDDDSQEGGMIDLTSVEEEYGTKSGDSIKDTGVFVDGEEVIIEEDIFNSPVTLETALRRDTDRVLRILADEETPMARDYEEVRAYLEAHLLKPNRVQIVVEEFLGMMQPDQDNWSRSPTPPRLSFPPSPVGKGKGKGKKTTIGAHAISPDTEKEASNRSKRSLSPCVEDLSNGEISKKPKTGGDHETELNVADDEVIRKVKGGKCVRRVAAREVITEEMLHGPFDFSQHRSKIKSSHQRTKNLSSGLHDILEEVTKPKKIVLTPSKLKVLDIPASSPPTTPIRNYIQPSKLTVPRTPSIEVVGEEVSIHEIQEGPILEIQEEVPILEVQDEVSILEIPDDYKSEEIELSNELSLMFPDTSLTYIRARVADLVGKPAAISRFTEELLENPVPPDNWREIYVKPFHVTRHSPIPPSTDDILSGISNVAAGSSSGPSGLSNIVSSSGVPAVVSSIPDITLDLSSVNDPQSNHDNGLLNIPNEILDSNLQPSTSSITVIPGVDNELDSAIIWETDCQEEMVAMFPDICPDWLLNQVQTISKASIGAPGQETQCSPGQQMANRNLLFQAKVEDLFSMSLEERKSFPTRAQWELKKKEQDELEKWSGAMSVNDMLELYEDDPAGYFTDPNRKPESESYKLHSVAGLKDNFRYHSITEIEKCFKKNKCLYTPTFKHLENMMNTGKKSRKTQRPDFEIKYPTDTCIEYLKEKKFCELEEKVTEEKSRRISAREALVETAREAGDLVECKCCYSPDCLHEDMIQCKGGHLYCKECVSRGCSVAIGDGKTIIECLGHCKEEIGWQELQKAVAPNVLSKLLQRRQAEEVGAAGLESLVTCPFCPYQTIMENTEDKVLACRNPECGRDSCRLCKEPNHVPLRCEEVEKKDEEEVRKKIEEQLSEAMIRECWKCKAKYFKEEGCNKMTCPKPGCGAKMCYLCKQPVKDYTHFYGQGGTPSSTKTCPLWTDNKLLHEQEVANAAAKAKEELAQKNLTLKNDPTKDISMPARPINPGQLGIEAPDLAEVVAPGIPREELVRQQRQIYDIIQGRGGGVWFPPHVQHPVVGHHHPHIHHPVHAWQNGFIQRMGEILRLREQNRANLRLVRQQEQQALRDIQHHNHHNLVGDQLHVPGVGQFGVPQAVPEPAPFLDLVEAQGRNIQVVQQQRIHPVPPPHYLGQAVVGGVLPPGVLGGLEQRFRRRPEMDRRVEEERLIERRRVSMEQQRERASRNREEAVSRLKRNREEVLRRQRRNRDVEVRPEQIDPLGLVVRRVPEVARDRRVAHPRADQRVGQQRAERVERIRDQRVAQPTTDPRVVQPKTDQKVSQPRGEHSVIQLRGGDQRVTQPRSVPRVIQPKADQRVAQPRGEQRVNQPRGGEHPVRNRAGGRAEHQREAVRAERVEADAQQRDFNFQEILDLDGMNPEYL